MFQSWWAGLIRPLDGLPVCVKLFGIIGIINHVVQYTNMGEDKKKETKIEKKDEFGNTVEETEIEEKEDD